MRNRLLTWRGLGLLVLGSVLAANPLTAEDGSSVFAERVAPLLKERCVQCHNGTKSRGSLDLTERARMLHGGDTGPALVPGDSAHSRLIRLVSGAKPKMPRQGQPLTTAQVDDFRAWIDAGAPWPKDVSLLETGKDSNRAWWSLQGLSKLSVPALPRAGWVRTPIDAFVLATLRAKGLQPSGPADRATLIRRVTFDLHGLPPTPAEIDAFLNDRDPRAYEHLIDRLLASPRYGERWGRHWLDVVHYGDTHGYDKDKPRAHSWPYREYVIAALNRDKPYAQFIQEQVAGDVLYPDTPEGLIATGFIAAGPWDFVGHVELREGTLDKLKTRLLDRDDMLANTLSTFMSLTVHCARCHDHKFDPIPQKDYYRLQAVFAGVERGERPYENPATAKMRSVLAGKKRTLGNRYTALLKKQGALASKPIGDMEAERARWVNALTDPQARVDLQQLAAEIGRVEQQIKSLPPPEQVYAILPHPPRPIHRLHRGNVEQPAELSTPGALSCLIMLNADFPQDKPDDEGGRRAALAKWITDPRNPLTWRSIINRVWHYHFGRGLVDTPNDFGRNGSRPTHPELLDWLAGHFLENGQSLKQLHRLILLSAVYQQSSRSNADHARIDADNRFWWRMDRQRLDAEAIRDTVLAVSGKLDPRMGGPGFELFRFKDDHSPVYDHSALDRINNPACWRRTVYRFVVRSVPNPFLECLDCADPNINTPVRSTTLTALQALALLNDPFMVKQAEFFAARLQQIDGDISNQIDAAYRLAFGRLPAALERAALTAYVQKYGLANACRLLFNTNEFLFID